MLQFFKDNISVYPENHRERTIHDVIKMRSFLNVKERVRRVVTVIQNLSKTHSTIKSTNALYFLVMFINPTHVSAASAFVSLIVECYQNAR
jgi:hypothetical protein